jgi:hypothetical protein
MAGGAAMADLVRHTLVLLAGLGLLCGLGALLPRPGLGAIGLLPACVATSLAAITFVAVACDVLGLGLATVGIVLGAIAVLAAGWRARRGARLLGPTQLARGELACFAVAIFAIALALWSGTWFSHGADTFYHLAAARAQALDGTALAHRVFVPEAAGPDPTSGTWHVVLALIAVGTGQDVATVWAVLAPVTAGLLALSIATLGRAASGSAWAGALGVLAYLVLERRFDLRTAPFPNEVAWIPLAVALAVAVQHLTQRTTKPLGGVGDALRADRVTDLEFPPAGNSTGAAQRALARRRPVGGTLGSDLPEPTRTASQAKGGSGSGRAEAERGIAGAALAVGAWTAAAGGVHLAHLGVALALLSTLALAMGLLPAARRAGLARLALLLLASAAAGGALLASYRLLALAGTPTGQGALGLGEPLARTYLAPWIPRLSAIGLTLVDPSIWFRTAALTVASVAALALVRSAWRGHAGAILLITGAWLVPLVALNPALAPWALDRFSYAMAKLATLLRPLPYLGLGWALVALAEPRPAGWLSRAAWAVAAAGLAVVLVIEVPRVGATTFGPADPQGHSVAASRAADLRVRWVDLLATLDALPGRAVLLADPETSYALAGLTRHWVVGVPLSHTPAQVEARDGVLRRGDVLDFFYHGQERAAAVLERYGVTHVVATERLAHAVGAYPFLIRLAAGSTWQLYHYDPQRLSAALAIPVAYRDQEVEAGLLRSHVPAGDVALVRVRGSGGMERLQLTQGGTVLAERELPAGAEHVVGLLVPPRAMLGRATLRLVGPSGTREIGEITVGRQVEAELLDGLSPDRDYDYAHVAGWASYSMSFFSRQRAATTAQPGVVLRGTFAGDLPAGDYLVRARVYDYGNGRTNALRVRIGTAVAFVVWGGMTAGMRWIETPVSAVDGGALAVEAIELGQGRVVLDALAIYPR